MSFESIAGLIQEQHRFRLARRLLISYGRHKPGTVPVLFLITGQLQLTHVQYTLPGKYIRIIRGLHRRSISNAPSRRRSIPYHINHLIRNKFAHHHALFPCTDIDTYLIGLTTFGIFQYPFIVRIEPFHKYHFRIGVSGIGILCLIHALPASFRSSELEFPALACIKQTGIAEQERIEHILFHRHKSPVVHTSNEIKLIVSRSEVLGLSQRDSTGKQVRFNNIVELFFNRKRFVRLIGTGTKHQLSVSSFVVRRQESPQRSDKLKGTRSHFSRPCKYTIVFPGHFRCIVRTPTAKSGITYQVKSGSQRFVGSDTKRGGGHLRLFPIRYFGCQACFQRDVFSSFRTKMLTKDVIQFLHVLLPGIFLHDVLQSHIRSGKITARLGKFQCIGNLISRTIIRARCPGEFQGIIAMRLLVQNDFRAAGGKRQFIVPLVQFHIVIVHACRQCHTTQQCKY